MRMLLLIFLNLFVLTVAGSLLAIRFAEKRSRFRVAKMLRAGEKRVTAAVELLRGPEQSTPVAAQGQLKPSEIMLRLEELLQQADVGWTVSRTLTVIGALALAGLLAGAVFPVLLSRTISMLVFPVAAGSLPLLYLRRTRRKRLDKLEQQLPDAMDFLARSMRAGHAFTIAIGMVGADLPDPLGRDFRTLFNEQNLGASLEVAFAGFVRRVPLLDARLFCSAAILQRRTGGNLSELLGRLAEVIRDRFRLNGHVKAASGHARMTAGILTTMPILLMLALLFVAPGYLQGLWADEDGKKLVGAALAAQFLGRFTISRIVRVRV